MATNEQGENANDALASALDRVARVMEEQTEAIR